MSAGHMGMVFAAEGLDGSETLLLLAYTNWTDPHGYCWPSEARLVDDCGTSRSTVQRAKRQLVKKNLVKSVRRKNSKGDPISNLTRVNLPLLASMARKRTVYDDNLIDQITFDDDTQGDPGATLRGTPDDPEPPSDLLMSHSDSTYESKRLRPGVKMTPLGMSQNDSLSLSDPEEISLSSAGAEAAGRGERESSAAPGTDTATAGRSVAGAGVPEQREPSGQDAAAAARIVDAYAAALGRPVLNGTRAEIQSQAAELLAHGLPESWLADRAREMPANGWTDFAKHVAKSKEPLPGSQRTAAASATDGTQNGLPAWCGQCGDWNPAAVHNKLFRTNTGTHDGEPCPACHPDRVSADA
ncbi:helix-turn-helix domain-containing protein [Streptomyces sp. PH10-H1]|uniref:helix-turn-helix domain-containing protein n=1 Tax=Streptomyces sp. PH10-H1 TaxID=3046212 RepID=UPI0024BB6CC4|nr:helix-turn-helix domain-containing protein [Streptomyces sp. PH10-H1]MDJ0347500.1 helix-turn-helix domain-containing protein [Streptomyces sp. PH10-H1]